jgi:hypothetical protein
MNSLSLLSGRIRGGMLIVPSEDTLKLKLNEEVEKVHGFSSFVLTEGSKLERVTNPKVKFIFFEEEKLAAEKLI